MSGRHVALRFGYGKKAWFGQSLYTAFTEISKVENGEEIVQIFREKLKRTNIFEETKKELKFKFKKKLSENQIAELIKILIELAKSIETYGAKANRID